MELISSDFVKYVCLRVENINLTLRAMKKWPSVKEVLENILENIALELDRVIAIMKERVPLP